MFSFFVLVPGFGDGGVVEVDVLHPVLRLEAVTLQIDAVGVNGREGLHGVTVAVLVDELVAGYLVLHGLVCCMSSTSVSVRRSRRQVRRGLLSCLALSLTWSSCFLPADIGSVCRPLVVQFAVLVFVKFPELALVVSRLVPYGLYGFLAAVGVEDEAYGGFVAPGCRLHLFVEGGEFSAYLLACHGSTEFGVTSEDVFKLRFQVFLVPRYVEDGEREHCARQQGDPIH